jgi:hypothetical protein
MSEPISPVEGSKPPVTERVKAVLGTLRRNPGLVLWPGSALVGAGAGVALALENPTPGREVSSAILGGVIGGVLGLAGYASLERNAEEGRISDANQSSDPGPVETGKTGGYKDLVTAWKTGKPVEPGVAIYHKDNPDGNRYSTDSRPVEE